MQEAVFDLPVTLPEHAVIARDGLRVTSLPCVIL